MREFFDKKTGISWVVPEVDHRDWAGQPIWTREDKKNLKGFSKELNEHKSESIDKFVTGGNVPLGDFVIWSIMGKELPYYAFDDGKLVAVVVLDGGTELHSKEGLKDYIRYRSEKKHKIEYDVKDFLPLGKAQRLLCQTKKNNNMNLGYIVVVPVAQGRGVGTRVISSIMHNPQFFARGSNPISMDTIVHKDNIPSQKAFKHNGFKDYSLSLAKDFSPFHDYIREI